MERKTIDMFISTCNYLTFLTEDIINSKTEIPPEVVITVNELMSKLFCFTNQVFKNDMRLVKTSDKGSVSGSNSITPVNLIESYTNSGNSSSIPFNISSAKNVPLPLYDTPSTGPVQFTQEKHDAFPNISHTEPAMVSVQKGSILNHITQAVEKVKPISAQKNSISNDKSSNKIQKQVDSCDVFITRLFSSYTDAILEGTVNPNNMGIYCRVCDTLCLKTWLDHAAEKVHIDKKINLKKLKMYTCRICRICIYGSKHVIIKYFEYHFRKIHLDKTDLSWEESLIETECSDDSSKASSISSLNCDSHKKSKTKRGKKKKVTPDLINGPPDNTVNVKTSVAKPTATNSSLLTKPLEATVKPSLVNSSEPYPLVPCAVNSAPANSTSSKTIVKVPSKTNHSSTDQSAMPSTPSNKKPMITAKPLNNNAPPTSKKEIEFPTSPYPDFDKVLNEMKNAYVTSALKLEVGYCTVCQKCVMSSFDWYDHKDSHDAEGNGWKEETCLKCHLSIYGEDHKKYLSLPGHNLLDKIMTGK